jgi:uncharacterized protein
MRRPEDAATAAVVALGRELRQAGVHVCVDQSLTLLRALGEIDVRARDEMYWAARCCLVHGRDDVAVFDAVFARFWDGMLGTGGPVAVEHGESDPRMPAPQHGGQSLPQLRHEGRSSTIVDGQPSRATREIPSAGREDGPGHGPEQRRGVLAAYSPTETLADREPLRYGHGEVEALHRLADELRRAVPTRRSRRLRGSARPGRLDLRRTVERSLRTDGEALRPAFAAPSRTPRRLVLLVDVSGSMDRYARGMLAVLGAVVGSGARREAFAFATRLTRLTGPLTGHDAAAALERARDAVVDWSGGTRIGAAIAEFNATFARRGLARGAIVLVVSDGWDRGDPDLLAGELERLRLQCRRLVWVDPRASIAREQPLAVGLRAALPHVDDYVAGDDPRAMAGLAQLIGGLGASRPARAQRPVRSGS